MCVGLAEDVGLETIVEIQKKNLCYSISIVLVVGELRRALAREYLGL